MSKHILIAGRDNRAAQAVAEALVKRGCKVTALSDDGVCACGPHAGSVCTCTGFNDRDAVGKSVAEVEAKNGPIDAMFISIPAQPEAPFAFADTPLDWWQGRLDAWLLTTANLCYHVGKSMTARKAGRIAVLSPDFKNVKGDCVMEAAAAGTLHGFIKSFGSEVAADNVLANVIFANIPLDLDVVADTAAYLFLDDSYTAAQVISLHGRD